MIDEKRLKAIESHAEMPTRDMISFSHQETLELIRLAKMGLEFEKFKKTRDYFNGWANWQHVNRMGEWAKEIAISTLETIAEPLRESVGTSNHPWVRTYERLAKLALDALPKEK